MDRFILTPYFLDDPLPELEALAGPDWEMYRGGSPGPDQRARMSVLHEELAGRVPRPLQAGHRPVSIAGDCCASIGTTAGMHRAGIDPLLIWFDAHGDFNTWETTPSGFLGGMPLAMLVGRGEQTIVEGAGLVPLREPRVVLVGARDIDTGEDAALAGSAMTVASVGELLDREPPAGRLHVHVDLDVVDPADMPAQNYPAPGGPTLRDVGTALERLAATG